MNVAEQHFAIVRAQLLLEMTEYEFDKETELPVAVAVYASAVAHWMAIRDYSTMQSGGCQDDWISRRCSQATANVLAIEGVIAGDAEFRLWLRQQRYQHECAICVEKMT